MITPAEAAKRGWVREQDISYRLSGSEARNRILPILSRLGGLYHGGATTTIGILELADLEIEGGGQLRFAVQNATPAAMKRLDELFEVLAEAVKSGNDTIVELEVAVPGSAAISFLPEIVGARAAQPP